jgi:hypothetical protein
MNMITVSWDVKACNLVERHRRIGKKNCSINLQNTLKVKTADSSETCVLCHRTSHARSTNVLIQIPMNILTDSFAFICSSLNYALSNSDFKAMKVEIIGNN